MATPRDYSAMTLIDEMLGTFIVSAGSQLLLRIEGVLYAPKDRIPEALANLANPPRDAREYVTRHLTRRLGAQQGRWPLTARFFLFQEVDDYVISAQADGTIVALPVPRRVGTSSFFHCSSTAAGRDQPAGVR